jgi:NFU1 iron-sulfur cluster scaffold homolog, mitochondrial
VEKKVQQCSGEAVAKPKVTFSETPNPDAGKFTVGRTLVEGRRGRTVDSVEAAEGDPVAARLLVEPGVRSVFIVADFVTVTKEPDAAWSELAPRVRAALREVL